MPPPSLESLAGGAFFRCGPGGRRLLSPAPALAAFLGVEAGRLDADLGSVLGKDAPQLYDEIFNGDWGDGGAGDGETLLPYVHPSLGLRWLSLRWAPEQVPGEGLLAFVRDESSRREREIKLAEAQSRDVENSARLQAAVLMEERKLAVRGLDYRTATVPSKLVDGDFIEALRLSEGSVDFILCDVMGKGMDAAILGAMIKLGFVRTLASSVGGSPELPAPSAICSAVDAALSGRLAAIGSFATLTYARFDEASRLLSFVDCGHTSIVHYSASSGECWLVKGANMPFGLAREQRYRDFLLPLYPGDLVVMFTDGLSECRNGLDEPFGEERIMYLVRGRAGASPDELASALISIGFDYSASGFNDDVSLICMKDTSGEPDAEAAPAGLGPREREQRLRVGYPPEKAMRKAVDLLREDLASWEPRMGGEERALVELAFHEALMNVVDHGFEGRSGDCALRWRLLEGRLSIEIAYRGPDYDWSRAPDSPLERFGGSGYGRLIMDKAMDSVLVAKGLGDRKRLVMCRSICRPAALGAACLDESSRIARLSGELEALRSSNYELRESMIAASDSALRDPASGLYGRLYADAFLSSVLPGKRDLVAAFARIDGIKELNRRLGGQAVDTIMRDLAALLQESLPEAFLFRWTGPVILVVLEGELSVARLEGLRGAVAADRRFASPITVSIAAVRASELGDRPSDALQALSRERLKLLERRGGDALLDRSDMRIEDRSLVLALDPDPLFLDFLVERLEREGFRAVGASRGGEALELMDSTRPELVVAELSLPQFDAFQIRTRMRSSSDLHDIPFILLTSSKSEGVVARALSLSIYHIFQKPLSMLELVGVARALLSRSGDGA